MVSSDYFEVFKGKNGLVKLDELLSCKKISVTFHLHDGYKKIYVITFPNGYTYYAKPLEDIRGASAEKILSEIYQNQGYISPDTVIGEDNGKLFAITNDVLPSHNTERGYIFLQKFCPGGAQYVFPDIFRDGESSRFIKPFSKDILRKVVEYYGLAFATENWDANYCNLNFKFDGKVHDTPTGIVSIDYEKSHHLGNCYIEPKFTTPFCEQKSEFSKFRQQFFDANARHPDLVDLKNVGKVIKESFNSIDEIVYKSKQSGFKPDAKYVDDLKRSMENTGNLFEKE